MYTQQTQVDPKFIHLDVAQKFDGSKDLIYSPYTGKWFRNEWVTTPDGRFIYNVAENFGGLMTANSKNPAAEADFYDKLVSGVYHIMQIDPRKNLPADPSAFVNKFTQALTNEGMISGLTIPERFPVPLNSAGQPVNGANQWRNVDMAGTPVEIPAVAPGIIIAFSDQSDQEVMNYSPTNPDSPDYKFIDFRGGLGQVHYGVVKGEDGKNHLEIIFRKSWPIDDVTNGGVAYNARDSKYSPEHNFKSWDALIQDWVNLSAVELDSSNYKWEFLELFDVISFAKVEDFGAVLAQYQNRDPKDAPFVLY